jgi:putative salt-induced outer membrane protein YdiY
MSTTHRCGTARAALAAYAALALVGGTGHADTILLDSGDRLSGRILRYENGRYELETSYAGTVRIDGGRVVSIEMTDDVTMLLEDRSRRVGRLVVSGGQMAVRQSDGADPVAVERKSIVTMTPGRDDESDWRVAGRVALGASDTSGNTDVQRLNADGEVTARRDLDRVTLNGRGNQATQAAAQTEANATVGLKYDRFVSRRWYAYGAGTLEHDQLKALRLRRTFGAGSGYQAIDTERTTLALEGGLDRVLTEFFDSPGEQTVAARLALRFDHWLIEDRAQFFHYEQNFLSLSALSGSFLRTQTGLRLPISRQMSANMQMNLDWDGDPAPGRRRMDRTLVFSVGYRW